MFSGPHINGARQEEETIISNQSYNRDKEQIVNHARRPPIPLLQPQD